MVLAAFPASVVTRVPLAASPILVVLVVTEAASEASRALDATVVLAASQASVATVGSEAFPVSGATRVASPAFPGSVREV